MPANLSLRFEVCGWVWRVVEEGYPIGWVRGAFEVVFGLRRGNSQKERILLVWQGGRHEEIEQALVNLFYLSDGG